MAHNFKLTGDYYVSVDGSDSNGGLTKDAPKRTMTAVLASATTGTKSIIVGAGVYKENISKTLASGQIVNIYGDGKVILEGATSNGQLVLGSGGGTPTWTFNLYDLEIRNYASILISSGSSTFANLFTRCIIKCPVIHSNAVSQSLAFSNCDIVANLTFNTIPSTTSFDSCNLINSIISGIAINFFKNNFVNSASVITLTAGITAANFNYNNVQGNIIMNAASAVTTGTYQDIYGRYYNLAITTSTGSGTVGDPYGRPLTSGACFSFTNHRILYPTFNANSISQDPKFNRIEAMDFTIQADSPHIGRASDGISNIGGTKYAIRDAANGSIFNTSAVSVTGLSFVGNDYVITTAGASGEVVSAPRFYSSIPKVIQKISYKGLLEFNKSITGGITGNRNVPDQEFYNSTAQPPNVAGANPDRLVYYLRFSTQVTSPASDSEWDNGGLWTAGSWGTFEWDTKPQVDSVGVGNGSPSFNSGSTPVNLNGTWIQYKIKLRDS